jgi:hypothetical protein
MILFNFIYAVNKYKKKKKQELLKNRKYTLKNICIFKLYIYNENPNRLIIDPIKISSIYYLKTIIENFKIFIN